MQFKNIIGHESVKTRLVNSVKDGRISHAQLFLGPEGCGNLPLAIAYAQYVSCLAKGDTDSCGTCDSCVKYEKLVHMLNIERIYASYFSSQKHFLIIFKPLIKISEY